MVSRPPQYCPHCGTRLETTTVEARDRKRCPSCDDVIWHNPVPCAGVAVVDRSELEPSILCVKRAVPPGVGEWTLPGGHMEIGEDPDEAAARELAEETGVTVDPDALEILDATALPPRGGKHVTMIHYVVDREETRGTPTAGSDAQTARFWTPSEFDATDELFRPIHEDRFRDVADRFA
ncbi:NUDIX domain-containing protein [Natrarchaeobius oligotrophus]|uniref:NUDIX domain-containing protein n=1 Tax=Natrarchaeobius chitinivorans TaxID=1679083 RepID=A0A3N6MYU4_NATCH|nr:NUDIX domain-containing protein [Natrarchaeobius chitinivorans]RQH03281.1 NUDIX domain-containing protein [Natrarchaeobius chitinivorans]